MNIQFKGPLIIVKDVQASKVFYETILNQNLQFDFGACQSFVGGLTLQAADTITTLFQFPNQNILKESIRTIIYFEVDDFDMFIKKLKNIPTITYIHDVIEYSWGQRSISFYDLDNHPIDVSEAMESVFLKFSKQGMTIEEVAIRTEHPLDFVKESLKKQ